MFRQVENPRFLSPTLAVLILVLVAFELGLITGMTLGGARPFDSALVVLEAMFAVGLAIWATASLRATSRRS